MSIRFRSSEIFDLNSLVWPTIAKSWINGLSKLNFIQNHQNLSSITLKFAASLDFSVIGQLKNLEELNLNFNYTTNTIYHAVELLTSLHQLNNLSKLRKLNVRNVGERNTVILSQFLNESASAESLETITMAQFIPDGSYINGLSRFQNLRYLNLSVYNRTLAIPDAIWAKLERLNHLNVYQNSNGKCLQMV